MEDRVFRLLEMTEALKQRPDIIVLHNAVKPGATEADLEWIEQEKKIRLAEPIKAFYRVTNGFQLLWAAANNKESERWRFSVEGGFPEDLPRREYLDFEGCINIWPLDKIFSENWSEEIYFNSDKNQMVSIGQENRTLYDYKKRLKPFDVFSKERCMCFYIDEEDNNSVSRLLLASGHYTDVLCSKVTDFSSYLEFLIANFGLVAARKFYVSNRSFDLTVETTDESFWKGRSPPSFDRDD